jgi:hypothetical protein
MTAGRKLLRHLKNLHHMTHSGLHLPRQTHIYGVLKPGTISAPAQLRKMRDARLWVVVRALMPDLN